MSTGLGVPLRRRMAPRDPHEPHRVSTPLELFFDLVFVVAISGAAAGWHHGLATGHPADLVGFVMVFFAIWWAWMNYTWFASSYDPDDVVYRLLTLTIMVGSLMLAAGIPELFVQGQSALLIAGYAIMRFTMVAMWLRAASGHPARRHTALAYAGGIALVQLLWIARLLVHGRASLNLTFVVLVVLELLVPVLAERRGMTPFHPHHIAERYALLTLIVLGEVILAAVQAVQGALGSGAGGGLLALIVGGLLIVFSMWWLYFRRDYANLFAGSVGHIFSVGYGHYLVFASVAATGAALAACVDIVQGTAEASNVVGGLGVTVAVAIYLLCVTLMHAVGGAPRSDTVVGVAAGVVVVAVALIGPPVSTTVLTTGLVLAAVAVHQVWSSQRHSTGWSSPLSTS